jgi:hypothetical protein
MMTPNIKLRVLLLLASLTALFAQTVVGTNVTASGGGIVKPGNDLVLTYNVGFQWDRCYWFW